MKFMGSKRRLAKYIIPVMMNGCKAGSPFIDLFTGGANLIESVVTDGGRIANDLHTPLIDMYLAMQQGWLPPRSVSEEVYHDVKDNRTNYESYLVGYIGYAMSYGGRFFEGYRRDRSGKRDYGAESYRAFIRQRPHVQSINFTNLDYRQVGIQHGATVYCDIPYVGAKRYPTGKFDHDAFWEWARHTSRSTRLFVSEYVAPDDFECVWRKGVYSSLTADTGAMKKVEKLWSLRS